MYIYAHLRYEEQSTRAKPLYHQFFTLSAFHTRFNRPPPAALQHDGDLHLDRTSVKFNPSATIIITIIIIGVYYEPLESTKELPDSITTLKWQSPEISDRHYRIYFHVGSYSENICCSIDCIKLTNRLRDPKKKEYSNTSEHQASGLNIWL